MVLLVLLIVGHKDVSLIGTLDNAALTGSYTLTFLWVSANIGDLIWDEMSSALYVCVWSHYTNAPSSALRISYTSMWPLWFRHRMCAMITSMHTT